MAKKIFKPRLHDSGTIITTKTPFGSTSDMIVDLSLHSLIEGGHIVIQPNEVVCKDDKGFYITTTNRIDTGMADPNRYANSKARLELVEKESST